jgi:hypothetical protein
MMMTKPEITPERINEIQTLIRENPEMGRTEISLHICRLWEWQSPNGQIKDMACRDMLRALDKAGKICLPPSKNAASHLGRKNKVKHLAHNTDPVERPLAELLPVSLCTAHAGATLAEFKSYLDQFHYLAFDRTVGENMKYIARDRFGTPLACLLYGSAAWSCADRDRFIGWDKAQKAAHLMFMTNHVRYLIFPWIRVFNLASHILALASRRINGDWEEKYGHGLLAIETFVECGRFTGACYKAANWIYVGRTAGRGRDGGHHGALLPEKDIYIYPLDKNYRKKLRDGISYP